MYFTSRVCDLFWDCLMTSVLDNYTRYQSPIQRLKEPPYMQKTQKKTNLSHHLLILGRGHWADLGLARTTRKNYSKALWHACPETCSTDGKVPHSDSAFKHFMMLEGFLRALANLLTILLAFITQHQPVQRAGRSRRICDTWGYSWTPKGPLSIRKASERPC